MQRNKKHHIVAWTKLVNEKYYFILLLFIIILYYVTCQFAIRNEQIQKIEDGELKNYKKMNILDAQNCTKITTFLCKVILEYGNTTFCQFSQQKIIITIRRIQRVQ